LINEAIIDKNLIQVVKDHFGEGVINNGDGVVGEIEAFKFGCIDELECLDAGDIIFLYF
jgi:hypothetical protein